MRNRLAILSAMLTIGLISPMGLSQAQDVKGRTLKFAFQNVKEHPQGQGAQKFAELVNQKSGGKIKVNLFPGGTLGGDVQTVSALQGGTIDLTVLNAGLLTGVVKDFLILDLPFLFNDRKEAYAVVDGKVGQALFSKLPEKGLVGLGYWDLGFRQLTNSKRPVAKPEDIQGLKIRVVQAPIYIDTFNTLGANAVPMPFPEVYTALEQKTVDGQENPYTNIESSKFYEVQKHLSDTRHIYNPQSVLISKKKWDKLSKDEQKIIQDAVKEATDYQRDLSEKQQLKALEALKTKMQFTQISPQDTAKMREKVKPVIEKHTKDVDQALVKEMYAEIEKVRGAK